MNIYIVFGIIIIGLGTLLIYYGSGKNDKQSQKEITDKIEDTQKKIEQLKSDSNVNQTELTKVENEFDKWAEEFIGCKEKKKLELEKTIIGNKESRINLNSFWRPQLKEYLIETKKLISAYNSKANDSIQLEIPDLPDNIFLSNSNPYKAKITFRPDIIWEISIVPANNFSQKEMVDFQIKIIKDTLQKYDSDTEELAIVLNEKRIQIVILKNTRLNLKNIPEIFEYTDGRLKEIARLLVENQLLHMK